MSSVTRPILLYTSGALIPQHCSRSQRKLFLFVVHSRPIVVFIPQLSRFNSTQQCTRARAKAGANKNLTKQDLNKSKLMRSTSCDYVRCNFYSLVKRPCPNPYGLPRSPIILDRLWSANVRVDHQLPMFGLVLARITNKLTSRL